MAAEVTRCFPEVAWCFSCLSLAGKPPESMLWPVWREQSQQQWSEIHRVDKFYSSEDRKWDFSLIVVQELRASQAQGEWVGWASKWIYILIKSNSYAGEDGEVTEVSLERIREALWPLRPMATSTSWEWMGCRLVHRCHQVLRGADIMCKAPGTLNSCLVWWLNSNSLV